MNVMTKGSEVAVPRYRQLADTIRRSIEDGVLRDNDALPSERELSERFELSRDTVRKAVRELEELGVVYSDHGRGTFVAPAIVRSMSRYIDGFSVDTGQRGGVAGQRILSVEQVGASLGIAGLMSVTPGEPLTRVVRVRTIDGRPVGLHDAHVRLPKGERIDTGELERSGSLYRLLSERFGIVAAEAVENLHAAAASDDEATHLGIDPGVPLLVCERIALSDRREPIEYCLMKYVSTYRYSARLTQHSR